MPWSAISAELSAAKSSICENLPRAVSCVFTLNTALISALWSVSLRTQPCCKDWPVLDRPWLQPAAVCALRSAGDSCSDSVKNREGEKKEGKKGHDDSIKPFFIQSAA